MSTSPLESSTLDFLLDDSDLTAPLPGATFARAGTDDRAAEAPAPPRSPPSAAPRSPQPRAGHGAPTLVGPSTSAAPRSAPPVPPAGAAAPVPPAQAVASSATATGRTVFIKPVSIAPVVNEHSMRTRGKSGITQHVDRLNLHAVQLSPLPRSVRDALADPNWRSAMQAEYDALMANDTWSLVPRPRGVNLVTGKWIFRHKLHADGSLDRYKARWVLRGFTQRPGLDYDETFSPVVKPATVRVVLSLALSQDWPIHQLDVKNAFLHGTLTETVYCVQPFGFVDSSHSDLVCRLNKSLYGLKQAHRA